MKEMSTNCMISCATLRTQQRDRSAARLIHFTLCWSPSVNYQSWCFLHAGCLRQSHDWCIVSVHQEKCHQYWPAERSARYQYFVVDPMAEYNMPQYILREFKVTDARVRHLTLAHPLLCDTCIIKAYASQMHHILMKKMYSLDAL